MNIVEKLNELSRRARQEEIPDIDICSQVMARLNRPVDTPALDDYLLENILKLWIALSGAATLTAVVVGIFALQTWSSWSQPLAAFFRNAAILMQ